MNRISAIIIVYNGAGKIERCLKSLKGVVAEIIVIDSFSTDRTAAICKAHQARVFLEKWHGYAQQKNIALEKAQYEWILWLDADEVLTDRGKQNIQALLAQNPPESGFYLKRRSQFLGRWMDHCWSNDYKIRLFRRDKAPHFPEKKIHETVNLEGPIGRIKDFSIEHYPYADLAEYFAKFISYTELAALEMASQKRRISWVHLIFAIPGGFLKLFFLKQGFRDGWQGFILIMLSAFYTFVKYARFYELSKRPQNGPPQSEN